MTSDPLPLEKRIEVTVMVPVRIYAEDTNGLRRVWRALKEGGSRLDSSAGYGYEIQGHKVKWGEIQEASRDT